MQESAWILNIQLDTIFWDELSHIMTQIKAKTISRITKAFLILSLRQDPNKGNHNSALKCHRIVFPFPKVSVAQSCPTLWTPWTIAYQAPLSMGFSRQEYWHRLPGPPPGNLPNPGIKLRSPALQADSLPSESPGKPFHFPKCYVNRIIQWVLFLCLFFFNIVCETHICCCMPLFFIVASEKLFFQCKCLILMETEEIDFWLLLLLKIFRVIMIFF